MTRGASQDADVYSRLLPGGSFLHALQHRQFTTWSDRGGASQLIGDRWAAQCTGYVERSTGEDWPIPDGHSHRLIHAIRLDELEAVEREANDYQLENPDFLLIGIDNHNGARPIVQAADAKFAVDRIKRSQVSEEVVRNLLTVPEDGVTRCLLESAVEELRIDFPDIVRGLFICPRSTLTDYLLSNGRGPHKSRVGKDDLINIPPNPEAMFEQLPMTQLIGTLARIDRLEVTPRDHLLSALYYFRGACACFYFWREEHAPLLANDTDLMQPEAAIVAAEITSRASGATSAFDLLLHWNHDASAVAEDRTAISRAAKLPVGMQEIQRLAASAGHKRDRRYIRTMRATLEKRFRRRIVEETGVIYANDRRSTSQLIRLVSRVSRDLRSEMLSHANCLAEQSHA